MEQRVRGWLMRFLAKIKDKYLRCMHCIRRCPSHPSHQSPSLLFENPSHKNRLPDLEINAMLLKDIPAPPTPLHPKLPPIPPRLIPPPHQHAPTPNPLLNPPNRNLLLHHPRHGPPVRPAPFRPPRFQRYSALVNEVWAQGRQVGEFGRHVLGG